MIIEVLIAYYCVFAAYQLKMQYNKLSYKKIHKCFQIKKPPSSQIPYYSKAQDIYCCLLVANTFQSFLHLSLISYLGKVSQY